MVAASARWVDTPTFNSLDQDTLINVEFENTIDFHIMMSEHFVEFFGLGCGSGEAVQ